MKKVSRFIRRWWWAFVAAAGTLFGVLWFVLTRDGRGETRPEEPKPKPLADRAREEIERIELEAEIERTRVNTQADARHAELDRIEELAKEDPREARRRLSEWLNNTL